MKLHRAGRRDREAAGGLAKIVQTRQLLRKEDALNKWVVRLGIPIVVFYLAATLLLGWVAGAMYTAAMIVILLVASAALRHRAALGVVVSLMVTLALIYSLPLFAGNGLINANPGILFAAVAGAVGPFMTRRHQGSPLLTAVSAHAGCLVAAVVSMAWSWQGGVLAVAWVVGVVVWRTGVVLVWQVLVARVRSRMGMPMGFRRAEPLPERLPGSEFTEENVQAGIEAEHATAGVLAGLPAHWSVLHSRCLPGTRADTDHLVIGEPGVFVLDSKNWAGELTQESVLEDDGSEFTEYRINGSADWLVERLAAPMFEAAKVAQVLNVPTAVVHPVLVFNDRMKMPSDALTLTVYDMTDPITGEQVDRQVHLVQLASLKAWLMEQPHHLWRHRGRTGRLVDKVRGRDPQQADVVASERYLYDLGVYADYALPPA